MANRHRWRKVPTHQGGFLLDGGVHHVAGLRLLLGPDNPILSVVAYTNQLQKHLPPVDTIDAIAKVKDGATGTISISFGTTSTYGLWLVACEKNMVSVDREEVRIGPDVKTVENERTGVPPEVRAWGEAIVAGKQNHQQIPEEALADLELIEAMLKSGEQGGKEIVLECQTW